MLPAIRRLTLIIAFVAKKASFGKLSIDDQNELYSLNSDGDRRGRGGKGKGRKKDSFTIVLSETVFAKVVRGMHRVGHADRLHGHARRPPLSLCSQGLKDSDWAGLYQSK